jgi:hypothetical protein
VPLLVDAWLVSGLTGEVVRLVVSLWLPRPPLLRLALLGVAAPVLATPLATAHLPHTPSLPKRTGTFADVPRTDRWQRVTALPTSLPLSPSAGEQWRLRLPGRYLASVAVGLIALIAAPYAEEFWRCARSCS